MTKKLDQLCATSTPFILLSDFEGKHLEVYRLDEAKRRGIEFSITHDLKPKKHTLELTKEPISFTHYKAKFDRVIKEIKKGNTYLLNLTQPTKIAVDATLDEIFAKTNAPYKIKYKEHFVCFSPESFIQIEEDRITTFPMKGTIDANLPNAKERILANQKEMAEHVMVVDLLRNDLGIVADDIEVEKFRYITRIDTQEKSLLQVSSKISGRLPSNWRQNFSSILTQLLPAGSISGTPKRKTLEIIKEIEGYERGFFSGIFGYFDGKRFDSCVMIRFIEKAPDGYIYKSGGGITLDSDALAEYNELLDKVYLP
ncbi:Para-aminobenzoate synthase, aminase component [hydrothermal vent metagenome]|uniref:Para-aminobenzoate synthase, aminase component n=1 Tax=hydrothermal vent metagenome TaxID=652676 RepID=A0A1W1C136_9ZZZZ